MAPRYNEVFLQRGATMKTRCVWGAGALALAVAVGALLVGGCGGGGDDPWAGVPGGEPRVLTSFPPLYCFAKNVAGDEVAVLNLLTTTGPHDHQPDHSDAVAMRR